MERLRELSSKIDNKSLFVDLELKIRQNKLSEDEFNFCNYLFNECRIFGENKRVCLLKFSPDNDYDVEEKKDKHLIENKELIQKNFKLIEKYLLNNKTLLLYLGVHDFWRIDNSEIYNHLIINLNNDECDNEKDMIRNERFKNCMDFWLLLLYRDYRNSYMKDDTFIEYMDNILENLKIANEDNIEFFGYGLIANNLKKYIFSK